MPLMLLRIALPLIIFALAGCDEPFKTEQFYAMGTYVSISVAEKNTSAIPSAKSRITELEKTVDVETAKINKNNEYSPRFEIAELIKRGKFYEAITDGRFNISSGTISRLYGFPNGAYKIPDPVTIEAALDNISRDENVYIDLGAYAKGWIVDEAIETLKDAGVQDAVVNAGGDLFAMGRRPDRKWRVAIQHPRKSRDYISIINLENMAVATSGDYERYFKAPDGRVIFHIFDATTGRNPDFYHSVSVIADTTEFADGLSTAFFLLTPDEIKAKCKRLGTPVLLYTRQDKIIKLCGWSKFEKK